MRAQVRRLVMGVLSVIVLGVGLGCGNAQPTTPSDTAAPGAAPDGRVSQSTGTGENMRPEKGPSDDPDVASVPGKATPLDSVNNARSLAISRNNLLQIGLAWQGFHLTYNKGFPAGFYDATGKKMALSWRVAILQYIGENALDDQFQKNEPWDSENNKKLIPQMPRIYSPPGRKGKPGFTHYRAFTGPGTALPPVREYKPVPVTGYPAFGLKMPTLELETWKFAIVAEASEAVEWTKPDELECLPDKPFPKLGGVYDDGFHVLLADASVQFLPKSTSPETIKAMIAPNESKAGKRP